jgi:hypothetical protein
VRVSVRKGTAPAVGSFVEFKARLSPPLEPLRPGGYDFARDMYSHARLFSKLLSGHSFAAEPSICPGNCGLLHDIERHALTKEDGTGTSSCGHSADTIPT